MNNIIELEHNDLLNVEGGLFIEAVTGYILFCGAYELGGDFVRYMRSL